MKKNTLFLFVSLALVSGCVNHDNSVSINITCADNEIGDQDDMCIWLHPDDPALSTIITSDKDKHELFVYNLAGEELYAYPLQYKPGNIDILYNFPFDGEMIDVIAFNERTISNARFVFFKVDKKTGELTNIGAPITSGIWSDELYGFCLYHSRKNGRFYAFGSDKSSMIKQYRFFDDGTGSLALEYSRTIQNGSDGPTEGMVADNEKGLLYAGNENQGIYVYQADVDMPVDNIRLLPLKKGVLAEDVEGLTIYYADNGKGYLIASSQGQSYFSVFSRDNGNDFVGKFYIKGVKDTDGIDVLNVPLNTTFRNGVFTCHNGDISPNPVHLINWENISGIINPKLTIDTTYWNPREQLKPLGLL